MSRTEIEFATFSSQIGKIDVGNKCPVWRAQVLTDSRKFVEAYIKHIPPRELFIECIASQIGRSLSLSIPRPLLVRVFPVHLPDLKLTQSTILFGSQDARYPSLQQFTSTEKALEQLRKWPDLLKAGCFDEWLANSDRHNGNILYSGANSFSLIDHSHAIPKNHAYSASNHRNTFLEIIAPTVGDELGIRRTLKKASSNLNDFLDAMQEDWGALTNSSTYIDEEKIIPILEFLNSRLPLLTELIGLHLNDKQLPLYASNG